MVQILENAEHCDSSSKAGSDDDIGLKLEYGVALTRYTV